MSICLCVLVAGAFFILLPIIDYKIKRLEDKSIIFSFQDNMKQIFNDISERKSNHLSSPKSIYFMIHWTHMKEMEKDGIASGIWNHIFDWISTNYIIFRTCLGDSSRISTNEEYDEYLNIFCEQEKE